MCSIAHPYPDRMRGIGLIIEHSGGPQSTVRIDGKESVSARSVPIRKGVGEGAVAFPIGGIELSKNSPAGRVFQNRKGVRCEQIGGGPVAQGIGILGITAKGDFLAVEVAVPIGVCTVELVS